MSIKSIKMKTLRKKMCFFLMSQGPFSPKIRFLDQKVCSVACEQTDRHGYRGHPFRVPGIFPSTYHQGSVQQDAIEVEIVIYFFTNVLDTEIVFLGLFFTLDLSSFDLVARYF